MKEKQLGSEVSEILKGKKRGRSKSPPFPRNSLKTTLQLAESIEQNNAGDPYDRLDLAKSIGLTPESSRLRTLIISSGRYGLTKGGYIAERIELTPLGSSIVAPTADDNSNASLRKSLLTPKLFNTIYTKFNKKALPREEVFKSTLKKEFGVESTDIDSCHRIIMENIKDYGLSQQFNEKMFLNLDKLSKVETSAPEGKEPESVLELETQTSDEGIPRPEPPKSVTKQIFVAHGKNIKPLEQLKKILDQFKIPYKVAIDEANQGRPISQKVSDLMHECSSAILIFTKDEETKDLDDNIIYRPSDNVVFELGAASVLYGNKIVIFKEDEVSFGSDFKDLGYISFDSDQLDAKAMDLIKELVGFGLLKLNAA